MNEQPAIQERTKQNLTEAFWSLYKEKPIEKISIREVTAKAGYNRSTFYLYYDDIYAIREKLEQQVLEKLSARLRALPPEEPSDSILLNNIFKLYKEEGEHLYYLLKTDPAFSLKFRSLLRNYAAGFMPELSDWRNACYMEFGLATITGGLAYWYENRDLIPIDEYVPMLRRYLYHGLKSRQETL